MRTARRAFVAIGCATLCALIFIPAAEARPVSGVGDSNPSAPLTHFGTGNGQSVSGFIAPASFDPAAGYPPAGYSTAGYTPNAGGFAGVLTAQTPAANTVNLYCVDFFTSTFSGLSYTAGTWATANVPFMSTIARILIDYFPNTNEPSVFPTPNQKAASVQAAIWFFSDKFVLPPASPLLPATSAIVADVLSEPAAVEPAAPQLDINGPSTGIANALIGPYTLTTESGAVTLSITDGELFADSAGATPITSGSSVAGSPSFFVRSASPATVTLTATSEAVPIHTGVVLAYVAADPANPNPVSAQKLIVAQEDTIRRTATAQVVVDAEEVTTTTATSTTSTTSPTATPSTGGGLQPPSTLVAAPGANASPQVLPLTGSRAQPTALLAATLVVVGWLFAATRRSSHRARGSHRRR